MNNLETVTTVPQTNEQLNAKVIVTTTTTTTASSSSSAAAGAGGATASSALAKFNRIIDSTLAGPAVDYSVLPQLSSATLQQRFNLAYPELVVAHQQPPHHDATSSSSLKGIPTRLDRGSVAVANSTPLTLQAPRNQAAATEEQDQDPEEDDDDDDDHPHHDEDNQMKRNDVHYLLKQLNSFSDIEEIEIVDMKQRPQRPQQLQQLQQHQQQQHRRVPMASSSLATMVLPESSPTAAAPASPSTQSHRLGHSSLLLPTQHNQFDDYLFESCHYLETNYFASTYRTAMVESSSHEFRPSTNSSSNSCFELHEMEPPSVICKAGAPLVSLPQHHHEHPPPPRYQFEYQAETRLTTSGVQTELTVESLAKLSNSTSSSSTTRAPPFFRCCYTPIDRWRERRQQQKSSSSSATPQPPKDV